MLEEYPRRSREISASGKVLIICTEPPHSRTEPGISVWRALALMTETFVIRIASAGADDPSAIPRTAAGEAIASAVTQFEPAAAIFFDLAALEPGAALLQKRGIPVIAAPAEVDEACCRQIRDAQEAISALWVDDDAAQSRLAAAVSDIPAYTLRTDGGRQGLHGEALSAGRSFEVVAKTLGLKPSTEAEEDIAQRLRHNLSVSTRIIFAHYNPWTRLYWIELEILGDIPANTVSGFFEASSDENLANAWATYVYIPGRPPRLRGTVALPADFRPQDVTLVVEIWGCPVARIEAPSDLQEERAGLIAMTALSDSSVAVDYWGDADEGIIQVGRTRLQGKILAQAEDRPTTYRIEAPYPFNRETLTTLPRRGVGQRFAQFDRYARRRQPSSYGLGALRDRHAGATAWLIGNGPSVRLEDLDCLEGKLTFGFNRFYLAHDETRLRPTYTVTGDKQMIEDFGEEIVLRSGGSVFVSSEEPPPLSGDYHWVRQLGCFPSLFSRDPLTFVTPGGSSLYIAFQIAYFMGVRQFYIYGADFRFVFERVRQSTDGYRSASGDGNHFIKNYRSGLPWCPPAIENILSSFLAVRQLMEAEGGFVRNATQGGALEVFERTEFEQAVAES